MAPATTSPVKILTDLGYPVWEMDADDILRALVRVINSLDPNDGRIPILQDAVKEIRGASRAATPSKAQKITEKRTRIKASNFIPKAKPAPKPKVSSVAMLPPAQDDNETIFAGLLNGLKSIASLLKNISTLLGVQFIFKRLLAARQRRKDALDAKKKRESELEGSDKKGLGDRVRKTITKPIVSFWDSLLNFFKNIILGSAVLGFYKWMQDPKNLETIQGIADWLSKNGEGVFKGVIAILTLGIGYRIFRLVSRVGKAIGKLARLSGALVKGGFNLFRKLFRLGEGFTQTQPGRKILKKATDTSVDVALKSANISSKLYGTGFRNITKTLGPKKIPIPTGGSKFWAADVMGANPVIKTPGLFGRMKGSLGNIKKSTIGAFQRSFSGVRRSLFGLKNPELSRMADSDLIKMTQNLSKATGADRIALNKGLSQVGTESGLDILSKGDPKLAKLITEGLKKTTLDPLKGVAKPRNILGMGSDMVLDAVPTDKLPNAGKKLLGTGAKKLATNAGLKGTMKTVARGLPLLGTYLDSVSAIEELKKGNFMAAGLFGAGAVTSLIPGMQGISLGLSLGAIGSSVIEDNLKKGPDLSMNKKKKEVNVVVVPTKTGGGQTNQQTGTSEVTAVSSIDMQNFLVSLAGSQYNMKHSAIGV